MNPRAPYLDKVRRLVVKIGSQVLAPRGELDADTVAALCAQLMAARRRGLDVVLVTSGAVAAGRGQLGLKERPRSIPLKQAAAAAGQPMLLRAYASHLTPEGQAIAQILLTADDVGDRRRSPTRATRSRRCSRSACCRSSTRTTRWRWRRSSSATTTGCRRWSPT
jgi:glutamate 5-kinase